MTNGAAARARLLPYVLGFADGIHVCAAEQHSATTGLAATAANAVRAGLGGDKQQLTELS